MNNPEARREPDVEAGSYIEDDPTAWLAFVEAVREYAAQFDRLTKHLGTPDAAAEVVAGSMLSWLADQRGVFIRSDAPRFSMNRERTSVPSWTEDPDGYVVAPLVNRGTLDAD